MIKSLIKSYITAEAKGDWGTIKNNLSGEALGEAVLASRRAQVKKEILDVKLGSPQIFSELATVTADITADIKDDPAYKDRYAIKYSLWKSEGKWKIFKAENVELERPKLSPGKMPEDAKKTLAEYCSLPYELKKFNETKYLANLALPTLPSKAAAIYRKTPPQKVGQGFKVTRIDNIGSTADYCIARVTYAGGENNLVNTAIVDMAKVAGQWKIVRFDISDQKRGQ